MSRAAVVAAARSIIEAEGVEACSMRALAERLGTKPPAVYRKVRNRDELLGLVLDDVLGEIRVPNRGTWQRRAATTMRDLRAAFARNPQLVSLLVHVRPAGSNGLRIVAALGDALRRAGFDDERAAFAISALWTYTFGLTHVQLSTRWAREEADATGLYRETLAVDGDAVFEFGLAQLLGGLERSASARSASC